MKRILNHSIRIQLLMLSAVALTATLMVQTIYVVSINHSTRSIAEQYLYQVTEQINLSVEDVLDNSQNVGNYLASSAVVEEYACATDDLDILNLKKYMDDLIHTVTRTNQDIYKVLLYRASHRVRYSYGPSESGKESHLFNSYSSEFENPNSINDSMLLVSQDGETRFPAFATTVLKKTPGQNFGKFAGTVVVLIDPEILNYILDSITTEDTSTLYLTDSDGQMIAEGGYRPDVDVDLEALRNHSSTFVLPVGNSGWELICCMDFEHALRDYQFFSSYSIVAFSITAAFLLLLILIINGNIVSPIHTLYQEIEDITGIKTDRRITGHYASNEIGGIAGIINRLLDHRKEISEKMLLSQKQLYQAELSRKTSDMNALESQVNPHFILNTLQCINGIAVANGVQMITGVVSGMSSILRYNLRERDIVTIREELKIVRDYLRIIDIRFLNTFTWEISVAGDLMDCTMPKMILQPLVENAVYHGLEQKGKGSLSVTGMKEGNSARFTVVDTGIGINSEPLRKL